MTKDNGGAAFPVMPPVDETGRIAVGYPDAEGGMTLRDWFAGQTMGAMLNSRQLQVGVSRETTAEVWAEMAYLVADAMIAERSK